MLYVYVSSFHFETRLQKHKYNEYSTVHILYLVGVSANLDAVLRWLNNSTFMRVSW